MGAVQNLELIVSPVSANSLNLALLGPGIWGQVTLCCWGHGGMFSSTPALNLLDAGSTHPTPPLPCADHQSCL